MAIELYTEEGTKIGELNPASVSRPAKGDFIQVAGVCYETISIVLTGTVQAGTPDLYSLGTDGTIVLRGRCALCDDKSPLPLAHKEIICS